MEVVYTSPPTVCFKVERVIGISSGDEYTRNYRVQWAPTWVSGLNLSGCEQLIEQFLLEQREEKQREYGQQPEHHNNKQQLPQQQQRCRDQQCLNPDDSDPPGDTMCIETSEDYKDEILTSNSLQGTVHPLDYVKPNFEWISKTGKEEEEEATQNGFNDTFHPDEDHNEEAQRHNEENCYDSLPNFVAEIKSEPCFDVSEGSNGLVESESIGIAMSDSLDANANDVHSIALNTG